jgi:hypothetical protein
MEQDRPVRDAAVVEVWDELRDKAEVEWEDRLPQARAEIAYARNAGQRFLMLPDSRATKEIALNVVQE